MTLNCFRFHCQGNDDVFGCQVSSTGRVFAKNLWNTGRINVIDNSADGVRTSAVNSFFLYRRLRAKRKILLSDCTFVHDAILTLCVCWYPPRLCAVQMFVKRSFFDSYLFVFRFSRLQAQYLTNIEAVQNNGRITCR